MPIWPRWNGHSDELASEFLIISPFVGNKTTHFQARPAAARVALQHLLGPEQYAASLLTRRVPPAGAVVYVQGREGARAVPQGHARAHVPAAAGALPPAGAAGAAGPAHAPGPPAPRAHRGPAPAPGRKRRGQAVPPELLGRQVRDVLQGDLLHHPGRRPRNPADQARQERHALGARAGACARLRRNVGGCFGAERGVRARRAAERAAPRSGAQGYVLDQCAVQYTTYRQQSARPLREALSSTPSPAPLASIGGRTPPGAVRGPEAPRPWR